MKPSTTFKTRQALADYIDETKLAFSADEDQESVIQALCSNAVKETFRSVCVRPQHVKLAKSIVGDSHVMVATVIGFPQEKVEKDVELKTPTVGSIPLDQKIREMEQTRLDGADEYDIVMNVRLFKHDPEACQEEFRQLVEAAEGLPIKLIIETDLLSPEEITAATKLAVEAGIDYVKTSTGFVNQGHGARVEDIKLMAQAIDHADTPLKHGIKASGGIRTVQQALDLISAGANIIGSSNGSGLLSDFESSH